MLWVIVLAAALTSPGLAPEGRLDAAAPRSADAA